MLTWPDPGENNLSFIETSALDASNVELAFQNILTGASFLGSVHVIAHLGGFAQLGVLSTTSAERRIRQQYSYCASAAHCWTFPCLEIVLRIPLTMHNRRDLPHCLAEGIGPGRVRTKPHRRRAQNARDHQLGRHRGEAGQVLLDNLTPIYSSLHTIHGSTSRRVLGGGLAS